MLFPQRSKQRNSAHFGPLASDLAHEATRNAYSLIVLILPDASGSSTTILYGRSIYGQSLTWPSGQ